MSKRDPNGPIPGFEDEYTGTVGHEKAVHKTHFQGVNERPTHPKDDPEWEYIGMGRWRRKPVKARKLAQEVDDGSPDHKKKKEPEKINLRASG